MRQRNGLDQTRGAQAAGGILPCEACRIRHCIDKQRGYRAPRDAVERGAPRGRQYGMHAVLILDFDAAEHRCAAYKETLDVGRDGGIRLVGGIDECAEDARTLHDHAPIRRNPDFRAAEDGVDFEHGRIAPDLGAAQVDFEAAEDGVVFGGLEIVDSDFALSATEDGGLMAGPGAAARSALSVDGDVSRELRGRRCDRPACKRRRRSATGATYPTR